MEQDVPKRTSFTGLAFSLGIAVSQFIFVVAFHNNYGYFRDELYYIACSDHLAWGYVDQPPFSIGLLAAVRWIAGDSLHAIRFLAAAAGACVVVLSSLTARRLGGGTFAQTLTALTVVASPVLLGHGRYFSMNAFDVLFWALALYLAVTIIVTGRERLWILFGLVAGLGLLNKYSIGFLCIGLAAGLLLSPYRKHLQSRWFWIGAALAALIFAPHVIWEIQNGLPSVEFMRNASREKNVHLPVVEFLIGQVKYNNYFTAPVWLLGIYFFFFGQDGKRYRALGWTYLVVLTVMMIGNAKLYYLSPVYPLLFAGGAVFIERTVAWNWVRAAAVCLVLAGAVLAAPLTIPVLPVESFIAYQKSLGLTPKAEERNALGVLPQHYADMFGWEDLTAIIARAYGKLSPEERSRCVVYVRNYGEAGAIDFFGKRYGLPPALCAHNNYWLWGPGTRSGDIAIIVGGSRELKENLDDLRVRYREVELVGTTDCRYCVPFENGRMIFMCKGMNTTFQALWAHERFYI